MTTTAQNESNTSDRKTYYRKLWAEKKARGEKRISPIFTADEIDQLQKSATAFGEISLPAHVKRLALAKLDDRYLVPSDILERMDSLLAIMRGIGNNLNQLARHSNEMRYFMDTAEVRLQLKRMDDEIRQFLTQPTKDTSNQHTHSTES
jgi:nitrate reductase beta subunit